MEHRYGSKADFILDDEAQKLADEAKKSSTCIPIGEGENCWYIFLLIHKKRPLYEAFFNCKSYI